MTTHETQLNTEFETQFNNEDNNSWTRKLPQLLRGFGAAAVLFSLYTFLMRGWEGSGDLIRYIMLLGHTGALTIIGLASGHFLKEAKGARLLLVLALISVPANFAILGAFIFSATSNIDMSVYPQYVAWALGSPLQATLTTVAALAVLLPIIWIGFRTLARELGHSLSLLYLFSNAAMLLPLRTPVLIAGLVALLTMFTLYASAKITRNRSEVKTQEGMTALLLQFLPLGILVIRNIWLYSPDFILLTTAAAMLFIALRQCSLLMHRDSRTRTAMELISAPITAITGLGVFMTLTNAGWSDSVSTIAGSLTAAIMLYEISLRSFHNTPMYRVIASLIIATSLPVNLLLHGGVIASLLTIIIGMAMIIFSYSIQQRSIFLTGIVMTIVGLLDQFQHLFHMFDFGYWVTMAIVGTLAIVGGSLLESRGELVKRKYLHWRNRYSEWSY